MADGTAATVGRAMADAMAGRRRIVVRLQSLRWTQGCFVCALIALVSHA